MDDLKIDREVVFEGEKSEVLFLIFRKEEIQDLKNDFSCLESLFESLILPLCIHDFLGIQGMLAANFKLPKTLRGFTDFKERFPFCVGFFATETTMFLTEKSVHLRFNETPDV